MSNYSDQKAKRATELLALAHSDPRTTMIEGPKVVEHLHDDDRALSTAWRAISLAARFASTIQDSIAAARESLDVAVRAADRELEVRARVTLAGSLALAGRNDEAMEVLRQALRNCPPGLMPEIDFQRGAVLQKLGESSRSLEAYERALSAFEETGATEWISKTLNNRAMLLIDRGELSTASHDLRRARDLDLELGHIVDAAYADHNLGIIAAYEGDIPGALSRFDDSEDRLARMTDVGFEVKVSRCEVLLSAGLFREAFDLAMKLVEELNKIGLAEDEAESQLVGAQAALLAGNLSLAQSWADRALAMFIDQDRGVWAANARLTAIEARFLSGDNDPSLVSAAEVAAETLDAELQSLAAFRAWLLAGSISSQLGLAQQARNALGRVAGRRRGPIEIRLQSQLANALLKRLDGDTKGVDAAVRAGLQLLDRYQAALGATDIRIGVERHARQLGDLGLGMAIASRQPRRVFGWMERTRSHALVHRPVAPPVDAELASQLAELRQVTAELRGARDNAAARPMRSQQRLQESIRNRARLVRGAGSLSNRIDPTSVADALHDRTLVEYASLDGKLWAIVIRNRRFRFHELGPEPEALAELHSLRFTMRRLAKSRGSIDLARVVALRLEATVLGSLGLGDGPLVIVPTPALHAVPWSALPTFRDRSVTVSPSAELWFRAAHASTTGRRILLVAGPDLELSDIEVGAVADIYPKPKVISSTESMVHSVESHLDGAGVAHIASHAYFQFENPMFSSLRLADGDLNVYDIERLKIAPSVVVLSACDSGFTETHPGEELMGLSSALLSMGTKSIIASVGLVPDSAATKDLMVALHRGLVAGLSPSHALHRAQTEVGDTPEGYIAASSFICIGAG